MANKKIMIGIILAMVLVISNIAISEEVYLYNLKPGDVVTYEGKTRTVIYVDPLEEGRMRVYFEDDSTFSADRETKINKVPPAPTQAYYYTEEGMPIYAPAPTTTPTQSYYAEGVPIIPGPKEPLTKEQYEQYELIGKPGWREYMRWKYHTEEGKSHPEVDYDDWIKEGLSRGYSRWEEKQKTTPMTASELIHGITTFMATYEQYRGFARFGSLFFTGEGWENYRAKVNQIFCDTILLGGTKCWTSRICDTQLYAAKPSSVFAGRTPSGERQATASIQAEKSLPIQGIADETPTMLRLYKITYAINNPFTDQALKYNIQFRSEEGYTFNWFSDYQNAPDQRTEANPLIEYGKHEYTHVCLIFHPGIMDYRENWHGRTIREWCTPIIEYIGTATKPYPTASNETQATATPSSPESLPQTGGKPGF